jgi:hypothetical protein
MSTDAEVFMSPNEKGPWGVVSHISGPQDPAALPLPELRRADALPRAGMVALAQCRPRQFARPPGHPAKERMPC